MIGDNFTSSWSGVEMQVAYRFAQNGCIVSLPVAQCPYDLVVDNGKRLYKIQVRTGWKRPRNKKPQGWGDREGYTAEIGERHKREVKIPLSVYDYLCVGCNEDIYVIPVEALESPVFPGKMLRSINIKPRDASTRRDAIAATERWEKYLNNFKLG